MLLRLSLGGLELEAVEHTLDDGILDVVAKHLVSKQDVINSRDVA